MLQLKSISLVQFKNYLQRDFEFRSRIIGISGANGIGKTNLLDAIYYLCFTKGYFSRSDNLCVRSGSMGFRIEGKLSKNDSEHVLTCILRETGRKEFSVDGEQYEKFAPHVGKFPCVFIAPDDIRIITEGSEERRRFADALLSQLDPAYLQSLINYNKLLQQRNSYLKSIAENRNRDTSLLDIYDSQLVTDGTYIFDKRREYLEECISEVHHFYRKISGSTEEVQLNYDSQLLSAPLADLLAQNRDRDIYLQRTSSGIHKDDIQIRLNDQPFRSIASQGQRKSLLFALRLAEFTLLKQKKKFAPLLLLDDVFEKLDETRMHNLLEFVCVHNDGQIFITDTHKARISGHLDKLAVAYQLIDL